MDPRTKRNFKLVLEYDGSDYHGWQRQRGVLTLQEVVESRLEIMLGAPVSVRASGRTDAGVHALGQVVNFYGKTRLTPEEIQRGLNSLLPEDVVVRHASEVPHSFHARFSARSKTYAYHVLNRMLPSAIERRYAWHVTRPLAREPMAACMSLIRGTFDFTSFMGSGSPVKSSQRHIMDTRLETPDAEHLVFVFRADGFLRHMVRNLVGTIVEVGKGKGSPEDFLQILRGKDRKLAGMTAPAHGLFLVSVDYGVEDRFS